jgi:hypothetical protein
MQIPPNKVLGHPIDRQSLQAINLGRNSQQATKPSKKLDVQIPQPSQKTYPNQVGFAGYPNLHDVSFPSPQGDSTKNKNHTKGIPVVRSGNNEKMGTSGLGEVL